MLDDRDYMRQPEYRDPMFSGFRWSWTVILLVVNLIIFVFQLIASNSSRSLEIQQVYFALSLDGLKHGYFWQLVTFQFMHAGWMHIIFNSLVIFSFGRLLEPAVGARRFLTLYFTSGIIGGGVQMFFAAMFSSFDTAVVGASAGAAGLIAAFAVLHWDEQLMLLIYFLPVTLRGKTLFFGALVLSTIGLLTPNSGIANAAHLGGMAMGCFFVKVILRNGWSTMSGPLRLFKKTEPEGVAPVPERKSSITIFEDEVDPILDKISAHGIASLTARERETLENARKKIGRQ